MSVLSLHSLSLKTFSLKLSPDHKHSQHRVGKKTMHATKQKNIIYLIFEKNCLVILEQKTIDGLSVF